MKKILSFFSLALLSIGIAWAATADDLVTISSDYTFIADNFTSNGTVRLEKDQLYDEGRIFANTGNTVASNKGKSKIGEKEYLNSLRVKNVQDQLVFKVAGPCKITFYTQSHATRGLQVGSTAGGTEYGKQEVSTTEFTCEIKAAGLVYLSSFEGDFYFAGFSIEFPEEAEEAVTLFSWEGAKDGAKVEGGSVTAVDKDGADISNNNINVGQKNFYTIKVDGAKDFTTNTVTVKLDEALAAGDKIAITAFRNKNAADKKSGLLAKFDKGDKTISTVSSDKEKAGLEFVNLDNSDASAADKNRGTEPNTIVLDIPEEAAGSTTITLTRAETGTNLFVSKLVISGARDMSDPDKDLTFAAYTSLDFNSAVNGAVSRGGRHKGDLTTENAAKEGITLPFEIKATDAKLTIAPNQDATNYPEGSEPCSKFVETMAGPQLVLSGGYKGVTLKLEAEGASAVPFQQINFKQTNWSKNITVDKGSFDPATGIWTAPIGTPINELTFTIKADTTWVCESKFKPADPKKPDGDQVYDGYKLIEVVLHDMGIWKINKILINPSEAIDEKVAAGTDLSVFVAEKIAELKKEDINPKYVKLELEAGKNYTVTNAIEVGCPLTIIGNGAIIDATASDGEFFVLSANPTTDYLDKSDKYYGIDKVLFDNINVVGLKKSIFTDSNIKYAVVDFVITGCVFQLETESTLNDALISFFAGGIKNFTVENSTFYGNGKGAKYFVRYNNGATIKKIAGTSDWTSDHLTFTYTNNTFYNLLKSDGEWVNAGGAANGSINTIVKNIWYNCGKSAFAQKVIAGGRLGSGSSATWQNNTYYRGGEDNSSNQTGYDKSGTILTTNPGFADAAKGDFTLSTTSDQYTNQTGDPRWFDGTGKALAIEGSGSGAITGIEAVKEAKTAEDGAWYTIQGQRVAQPTKGLYIHNGKKVVIK